MNGGKHTRNKSKRSLLLLNNAIAPLHVIACNWLYSRPVSNHSREDNRGAMWLRFSGTLAVYRERWGYGGGADLAFIV